MAPYTSFEELVGEENVEMATELKRLYGDIEAVELVVGMFVEKKRGNILLPETAQEILARSSLPGNNDFEE